MKRIVRAKSPRETPVRKKLRGGQIVVPVNSLETDIYVNFTITGTTITAAAATDGRISIGTIGPGTISLTAGGTLAGAVLKDYTIFGYNGTIWKEIPRGSLDMGGTSVALYGTSQDIMIRKVSGVTGKGSANEVVVPTPVSALNFKNLADTIFGFTLANNAATSSNAYIQLTFNANYPTPATKQSGWSPSSVPGLTLWLDALEPGSNGFTPNVGTAMPNWRDKSGRNNHATTTVAPLYKSNAALTGTNKMGMYFNGTTSFFSGPIQNDTNYCCIFSVIGPDLVVTTNSRIVSLSAAGVDDATGTNIYASSIYSLTTATGTALANIGTANSKYISSAAPSLSYGPLPAANSTIVTTSIVSNSSVASMFNGVNSFLCKGYIAGTTLTLSTVALNSGSNSQIIYINSIVTGPYLNTTFMPSGTPVSTGTIITDMDVNTNGGIGTYTVSNSQTVGASGAGEVYFLISNTLPLFNTPGRSNLNLTMYSVGKNNSGVAGQFFKGYIHEVLVYTKPVSKQGRQTIEGYLAWKWGVTLPSVHPYTALAPTVYSPSVNLPVIFSNNSPIVWLDAQDPLANEGVMLPTPGTSITGWYDKSGNNNNGVTISTFAPMYRVNSVMFNGTSTLKVKATQFAAVNNSGGAAGGDYRSCMAFYPDGKAVTTSSSSGTVSTITNGTVAQIASGLTMPTGVAIDSKGNVYVTERNAHVITRIASGTNATNTVAGQRNTLGVSAEPYVAKFSGYIDNPNNQYVLHVKSMNADNGVGQIVVGATITTGTNYYGTISQQITTSAGDYATYILISTPNMPNTGSQYIPNSNPSNQGSSANPIAIFTSFMLGGTVSGTNARFNTPYGIAIDKNDILYIVDWNHMVRRIRLKSGMDPTSSNNWIVDGIAGGWGVQSSSYGSNGTVTANSPVDNCSGDIANFSYPMDIAVDDTSTYLYVADKENNCIRKINISTRVVTKCQNLTNGTITKPYGVICDQFGLLYVSNSGKNNIIMYDTENNTAYILLASVSGSSGATGITCYNNTVYYCLENNSNNNNVFMSVPIPRPTYLYSPIMSSMTNYIHAFIVCTNSDYNRNVTSILSLASNTNKETYTNSSQTSGTVNTYVLTPGSGVLAEDVSSSSYIGLYNDNGARDVYRNNMRVQTGGISDCPQASNTNVTRPPNLIYFGSNNTSVFVRLNGTAKGTGNNLATGTFSYFNIGAYGLGLQPSNIRRLVALLGTNSTAAMTYSYDGYIYEVIVYTNNLTTGQYQLMEAYLCWKWGINLQDTTNPFFTSSSTPPLPPTTYMSVAPTPITDMLFTNVVGNTGFTISWKGGLGASKYTYALLQNTSASSTQPSTNNGVASNSAIYTSLQPANYYYTVTLTPINSAGSGTAGTAILLQTPAVPSIASITMTGFTVNVTAVAMASSYNIYLNGIKYTPTSSASVSSLTFTNLLGGTTYSTTVTAVSSTSQESPQSPAATALTLPSTPYMFVFSAWTSTGFTLSWYGGTSATSYTYAVSPAAGSRVDNGVALKSASFTGLTNTTQYTITVTATNASGSSGAGSAKIYVGSPTGLAATAITGTSFTLTFTGVNGVTSYNVYINGVKYINTTSLTVPVTNLAAGGTIVSVVVTSVYSDGAGWSSDPLSVALYPTMPVVVQPATNIGGKKFTITWTGGDGATSYTFNYTTGSGPQPTYNIATKTAVFTGLSMLTSYAGTITANLAGGASVTSATSWSATTLGYSIKAIGGIKPQYPNGNGLVATSAQLYNPSGVAVDSAGNVYIADSSSNKIHKITAIDGIITTIAGTGYAGYLAEQDGGAATSARLSVPNGVAVDSAGNVYIADTNNQRIRKIDSAGIITTIAGTGTAGFLDGTATSAQLYNPQGIAVDSAGNVYIADKANHRIRKITTDGKINTIAGTGTAGFSGDGGAATSAQLNNPLGVAIDSVGNVYIADTYSQRIRKIDSNGTISTIAGTGTAGFYGEGVAATSAKIYYPSRVAVDSAGNVYIADTYNYIIRKITTDGQISTIAGTSTAGFYGEGVAATSAQLNFPSGVAIDSAGNVYIADTRNYRIRKITADGKINTIAGFIGDGGPATSAQFATTSAQLNFPSGVAVDSTGNVYISDYRNQRIRKITASTGIITTIAGTGTAGYSGDGNAATSAQINLTSAFLNGVAVDSAGNVYISDQGNHRIRKITTDGKINTIAGTGTAGFYGEGVAATSAQLNNPSGVAIDSVGNVYIADKTNQRIRKINSSGIITTIAGTGTAGFLDGTATSAQLYNPSGVAVDSAGNVYIADSGNYRIRKITGTTISTIAGTAAYLYVASHDGGLATSANLYSPQGIAIDSAGNVYIADTGNNRIRKINSSGIITTIAGSGIALTLFILCNFNFLGTTIFNDGDQATSANLNSPQGVAVDSAGNVYIVDTGNNLIEMRYE